MVSFLRQRASNEICACEMLFFEAPCCRVSPLKSDSSCADVDGQYLAPPATSTFVSPGQQRYGYAQCVAGLASPAANTFTSSKIGLAAPSRVLGEKSSHASVPGSSSRSSWLAAAKSRMPSTAALNASGAGTRGSKS
eukprot:scaffold14494_cov77-Phaeocystis_antarctica.AAC.1